MEMEITDWWQGEDNVPKKVSCYTYPVQEQTAAKREQITNNNQRQVSVATM